MTIEELKNEAIQKANELTEQMLKEHEKKLNAIKEEYDKKIAKLQEEPKTGRWKPEFHDKYYYIDSVGVVCIAYWENYESDKTRYALGNVFKTQKEATFAIEQLKVLAELKEYADDDMEWNNYNLHWDIEYNANEKRIKVDYYYATKNIPFNIYFSTEEQAQKAIDAIGEDRLKKYYFCVEE